MSIRKGLEEFNYEPCPEDYQVKGKERQKKPKQYLDNGAEYEGEWNMEGHKDGQGI